MWISRVEDIVANEKKDQVQVNNPLMMNNNLNNLKSTMTMARRPVVQRTVTMSELSNDAAAIVSLSQRRVNEVSYASALNGVDESLFMAD